MELISEAGAMGDVKDGNIVDAIIAYVEQHQGLAALSVTHEPYDESDDFEFDNEANDGGQDSENR